MEKRLSLILLTVFVTITAAAQVRPFVQAGLGSSQFWLMNAEGTEGRFAYHGGVGVEFPIKETPLGIQAALIVTSKPMPRQRKTTTLRPTSTLFIWKCR